MKLVNHTVPSAASLINGEVEGDIKDMSLLYRKTLDENYGKNYDAVNEALDEQYRLRMKKQGGI